MRALAAVAITIAVCAIRADTPLPPPGKVSAMSPIGRFQAMTDPQGGTSVEDMTRHKVLWSLPGWPPQLIRR